MAAALVLVLAGCGARVPPAQPDQTVARAPEQVQAPETADPQTDAGVVLDEAAEQDDPAADDAAERPSPERQDELEPVSRSEDEIEGELAVTVEPRCAVRGRDTVTVQVQTGAWAAVAAAVTFSDNQSYGTWTAGPANQDGLYTYRFLVPLSAPTGEAFVFVMSSGDDEGNGAGRGRAFFTVVDEGGCS